MRKIHRRGNIFGDQRVATLRVCGFNVLVRRNGFLAILEELRMRFLSALRSCVFWLT